jgi:glycosyltransferase involved in cell wall biosynthesis
MNRRVDQVVAGFAEGDAISNEARAIQGIFRKWGWQSDIFADPSHTSPLMRSVARPLSEYGATAGDGLILHYSIASPANALFMAALARKVVIYHNITPPDFYRGYDDRVVRQLEEALGLLKPVVSAADAVWADSAFNATELQNLTGRAASVFPLLFDATQLDLAPDPNVFIKLAVPMTNLLFVGRMAPNKRIENLILAFAWYHRVFNRQSRLLIVGSERTAPRYYLMLRMLANELDLPNVCFERYASANGLPAYYELADVFVTASEHEGYCLPLVEAMHKRVPVVARRTGGMPEALGEGGLLYEDASPEELGALLDRVVRDSALRQNLLQAQASRMDVIRKRDVETELRQLLAGVFA